MSIGWFLVPNALRPSQHSGSPYTIYCAMDDYTATIAGDSGDWSNTEVLGGYNIVKVRASDATLATLAGLFQRVPVAALDNTLSSLTTAQKNQLHTIINNMGYSDADITAALGNFNSIGSKTLRQVFNFIASKRQVARYSAATDQILYDGAIVVPTPVDVVDTTIQ